jgi:Flp pilus assembly protein TadG
MHKLKRPMPGQDRRQRGAAAAEFAIMVPFLAFILIIAIDFCRLFFAYNTVTNSARNGALWASDPFANGTVTPSQSPYATVQAAALADANNLNPALTAANITQTSGTDGQGNATVVIKVQYPFKMITSYLGFSTVNLSRQVTMRIAPQAPN